MLARNKVTGSPMVMATLAFALSLAFWHMPGLRILVYPFRLFVTLIHELGHGLAALLTGGRFVQFTVAPDTSGLALTAGGSRWLIIPAGYIGAALFGGLLLVLTNRSSAQGRRLLAMGLGAGIALTTLLFARNTTALVVGVIAAGGLMLLGWRGAPLFLALGLNLLAIQCSLNALDSVIGLVGVGGGQNDAQAMADLSHVPAVFWALLWSGLALAILATSVWLALCGKDANRV